MNFKIPVSSFQSPVVSKRRRAGFTIVELLVVIAIMAVLASLATGAAIKSIKQARNRRIDATVQSLNLAMANYRALRGEWPYSFNEPNSGNRTFQTISGKENAAVFKKLWTDPARNTLVDASTLLTSVPGLGRTTVQKAIESRATDIPVGYPNPNNTDDFKFFTVRFNFLTNMAQVER
jgi:prepilin-type N-terminal cleavage/methylation domain-containing protein